MKKELAAFSPHGTLRMQPSKSILHRALICAALAEGDSKLLNLSWSADVRATAEAVTELGLCTWVSDGSVLNVRGGLKGVSKKDINCGESGSTMRFLMPLAMDGSEHVFKGLGRLLQRPFGPYEQICQEQGIFFEHTSSGIIIQGKLHAGIFVLPGDISSQFVTGLLLALPLLGGESDIVLQTPLESAAYVEITRSVQEMFGVVTEKTPNGFHVCGGQHYTPTVLAVEGDHSHAAFFAVAAALAGSIELSGLNPESVQGDRVLFGILEKSGARVEWKEDSVHVTKDSLRPFDVDVSQIPDAVPALAILGAGIEGTSVIRNAGRVRLKESDRLSAMAQELKRLGADVEEQEDSLVIHGTGSLHGGEADSHGDHRVAMALSVASLLSEEPVLLNDAEVVAKSAPQFFHEWEVIGGGSK